MINAEPASLHQCICCKTWVDQTTLEYDGHLQAPVCHECKDGLKLAEINLRIADMPICKMDTNRVKGFMK